jgi:hypothetical protein
VAVIHPDSAAPWACSAWGPLAIASIDGFNAPGAARSGRMFGVLCERVALGW